MAKDFDGKEVKASRTTTVKTVINQDKHQAANKFYFAIRLQSTEEKDYLKAKMTEKFGETAAKNAFQEGEVNMLFTVNELLDALHRAGRNPEDVPQAGLFLDIIEEIGEWVGISNQE